MKKLINTLVAILLFGFVSMAQTANKNSTKTNTTKTETVQTKNGVVLKKDGTPDKRYTKTDTSKGPLKKDGTVDKRFKKNKTM